MGDTKPLKKKYGTPVRHWEKSAIEENKILKKEYGIRCRKEILIASSFLKKYKSLAKKLIAIHTPQSEKEKKQILEKLRKLGLIKVGAKLDDILSLQLKDVLERRVQSLVYRKGFSRTVDQARQFIVHRHITTGDKEITSPGALLTLEEENKLGFKPKSSLSKNDHPERVPLVKPVKEIAAETRKDKKGIKEETKMPAKVIAKAKIKPAEEESLILSDGTDI